MAAHFMLGMIYYQDCDLYWDRPRPDGLISLEGCPREAKRPSQNYTAAAKYLKFAASTGYPLPQYQLARMYKTGKGVPQDYAEAVKLYRSAIDAGMNHARGPLAQLYIEMRDFVSAHVWFNLAAITDDLWAAGARDDVAKQMTPLQIAEAQKLAREWDAKHKR